jgi:uncharacterized SAM-binding protein YcdF (DUF218 family)
MLKKFIGYFIQPFPFGLALMLAGSLLVLARRAPRLRRWLVGGGLVWLLLLGNSWIGAQLVRPLESQFPPMPELPEGAPVPAALAACRFVAVLGSGHADAPGFSANNELSPPGLARIIEGVRLLRALPEARLIVSGPGLPGHDTHAEVLRRAAITFGVAPDRIMKIQTARDTEDESVELGRLVGAERVALVTSAVHMPRAVALCRHAGVRVLPCPADFTAPPNTMDTLSDDFGWDVRALERSSAAVRERVGWLWVWLRGKTSAAAGLKMELEPGLQGSGGEGQNNSNAPVRNILP